MLILIASQINLRENRHEFLVLRTKGLTEPVFFEHHRNSENLVILFIEIVDMLVNEIVDMLVDILISFVHLINTIDR